MDEGSSLQTSSKGYAAGIVLLLGVACHGGNEGDPASQLVDARNSSVAVLACDGVTPVVRIMTRTTGGLGFEPAQPTIHVGEVIEFAPSSFHDMVSGTPASRDGLFDSGDPGEKSCLRFEEAGSFPFFCSVHNSMRGTVTVD